MTAALQDTSPSYDEVVGGPLRTRRPWRGREQDPAWVRPALLALLASTAALYLWDLAASGWANSFYAAAVQAGSHSWKAMFFGSSDASNFITVDKPPASLWVMDLSARVFGFNAWSMLVPQALEGVASVGLLYLTVRRVAAPAAALLAGLVFAATPVAALMFRFNNPDALLVLTLVGAAYATTRALEAVSTRWLALAGALVGLGFLTKMLQAVVIVPVLAGVYLLAAPTGLGRRVRQLLVAGSALLVAAGWWIAVVELWPASSRPYIGGSQTNSILELTLGYNGLGRLTGNETGSVGGAPAGTGTGQWGSTGLLRLFSTEFGGQVAWLVPAALVLLAGGLWTTRRGARVDRLRASFLLWGGWLVVTGLVFSFAKGIIHPYYSVALAPAIGAVAGVGAVELWNRRGSVVPRLFLAGALVATGAWTYQLMTRTPSWHPGLRGVLLFGALLAAAGVLWLPFLNRQLAAGVAALALTASLAAPALASVETAGTPHSGAIPTASPSVQGARGPGGGGRAGGRPGGFLRGAPPGAGGAPGAGGPPGGGAPRGGGPGNLLGASMPSADLVAALKADASSYTWVAAAVGSNSAAGPQLASGLPVMAIGGFNGSDPTPTLAAFEALVTQRKIHYFLGGSGGGPGGGRGATSSPITAWVAAHYTPQTIGGLTVYDLTQPTA